MNKVRNLFSGMLAVLAVLLLTGCGEKDNPVRTSLDVDTSTLTLSVGESAVRMASSKAEDAAITYTSSKPAVATVDQFGKVTAMSEGTATITIEMAETKKSWYAAKTITYEVVVKNVSAKAVANVDKATPLTLVAQADGKITVTFNGGITLANDIKYTINNGAEQTIAKNTSGAYDITVKKGDVVQLYSLNSSLGGSAVAGARGTTRAVDDGAKYINIRPSMKTEIYGNVMSLLKGKDNLESATTIEANNAFYGLFAGADKLVNNTERLLVLPATTLMEGCYDNMFSGCKGIEKAPELPAPKLEKGCYQEMFYDCAKLNHVKCLATDIKAENSTKDWLGKAGTEATSKPVLESVVDMKAGSDDGVPEAWTAKKIVLVESVTLGKTELALVVNEADVTLTATVKPDDATDKTVTWTSSNPAVATVDANGKVHAVAAGTATITAQAGDKTATCVVTVTAAPAGWTANDYNEATWNGTKVVFTKKTAEANPKIVEANTMSPTFWSSGWYTVSGDVTITGGVILTAETHLILQDGAKLTINGPLSCNGNKLYIYGQAEGDGKLNVIIPSGNAIDGDGSLIEVHGGVITVEATNAEDCGIQFADDTGSIKLYGGKLTVTSAGIGINSKDINVYGGNLTATSTKDGGIRFSNYFRVYGGEVEAISNASSGKHGIFGRLGPGNGESLVVYGGKVSGTGSETAGSGFYCDVQSGTSGIKFYSSDNGTWGDGIYYEDANPITSDEAKRYYKAE